MTPQDPPDATKPPDNTDKIPEKWFPFLGLTIVRKADVLAATAFILATASSLYQVGSYLRGANVSVFSPDNVVIFFDHYSDGEIVTRIASQLTFTNSGAVGRSGTVREAWVNLSCATDSRTQATEGAAFSITEYWFTFPKLYRDGEILHIDQIEDAYPLQVPGEGTISKLTGFAPRLEPCAESKKPCDEGREYFSDSQFIRLLAANLNQSITFTFGAKTVEHGDVTPSRCRVLVTNALITILGANDWYAARCIPL